MSEMIRNALRTDLLARSADWCATRWLLEATPYVFAEIPPEQYWQWKNELAAGLSVDPKNVVLTGSGAVGVSLSPYKQLRSFDSTSDIDVAVISTHHFDLAWRTLRNLGTRRYSLTQQQSLALKEHVNRYIYWGAIATDRLLPILSFAGTWMEVLARMARVAPTIDRDLKVRIYRDFASLRTYINMGMKALQNGLYAGEATAEAKIE
jgi:hypothetical protein